MKRRSLFQALLVLPVLGGFSYLYKIFGKKQDISINLIKQQIPIDFEWPIQEPFLFCVHHFDRYPAGNEKNELDRKYFAGRNLGEDFEMKDGFRLYHGEGIPGFPAHPHRGFETITIVRKGYVDHADSLGAAGRYGEGDVQWMTAGRGVKHCEMFPLLHKDKENIVELFQIWLNLPSKNKMVPADFKMLWANQIPKHVADPAVEVAVISGDYKNINYFNAPKNSWAANPENEVNILLVKMKEGGHFEYPKSKSHSNRTLYFFSGSQCRINDQIISMKQAILLDSSQELHVEALGHEIEFLFLEAKPIGEPIVQRGPFVMNTMDEINQTISDYQSTLFGGWNWPREDMFHGPVIEKFAKYPDGRIEKPS